MNQAEKDIIQTVLSFKSRIISTGQKRLMKAAKTLEESGIVHIRKVENLYDCIEIKLGTGWEHNRTTWFRDNES